MPPDSTRKGTTSCFPLVYHSFFFGRSPLADTKSATRTRIKDHYKRSSWPEQRSLYRSGRARDAELILSSTMGISRMHLQELSVTSTVRSHRSRGSARASQWMFNRCTARKLSVPLNVERRQACCFSTGLGAMGIITCAIDRRFSRRCGAVHLINYVRNKRDVIVPKSKHHK